MFFVFFCRLGILLTSPIFVAQIGEPPEVSQPNQGPCYCQQKFQLVRPLASIQQLSLLYQAVILTRHLKAASFKAFS